ncbi:MAG: strawberry notch C-terminal domain-containing protein [Rhodobacteraceae bacterium]|nr:strawberry notch C-terminal domain-containing protein [Paracoccaceae bacterium]
MAKWYAFPPRSPLRLHYTLEDGGQRRFILRMPPRINAPNLFAAGWRRPGGIAGLLSGMAPDPAALFPRRVRQWMAQHGAESIDLPQAELRRRYFVPRVCPLNALTIGINRNGAEVRESGDDRWLVLDGLSQEESWAGSERLLLGGQLDLSLRMRDPSQYQPLAARIADEVAVNRLRINPDEMQELAAALIKPGHRDLPTWTASADQSYALLQQEIMLAMLAPARDSAARPLHSSARRLISAIPSLRDGGDTDPPPDVMAALAAVVGPLEAAQLVAPNGDATRGWGRFFTGADDSHAVLDLRGLPPHEAAATITTECARRNGRVVTLLATDPHSDDGAPVLQAWQDVARVRGVEAAAVLPDETIWEGPATFIAFGQRRENLLDAATGVSMRLEREQVREDLSHWIYEAQRGRAGIAGQQDRLAKLTDYRPASNVSTAVLKLPRAQAADARRAMRRLMTDHGAVDAYVAGIMGLEPAELAVDPATGHGWSAEQIDAIALAESAHRDQGRGFILADQTGTGKGRTAMGCARAWLNGGAHRKVIYLTVDKAVAVDGVLRDLVDTATEGLAGRPLVIARDSEPPADLADAARSINQRRELYQSGGFPADRRFLISTYPAFQAAKWDDPDPDKTDNDRAPAAWLQAVCNDPAVMVILDESHKALNREGNIGHNMRAAIAHAGRVLFVSATALRDGRNVDLYRRVFPPTMSPEDFQIIEAMLRRASAMELESFAASLIRDGVMLRREHDSADIIRSVAGPTDTETQSYDQVMNGLRGLASALLEAKRTIRTRNMGGAGQGWRHWSDAAQVNMTAGMGVILDQISSLTLASMTIPQTARVASLNIAKGRKPVISMTRTNESYLQRILSGDALLTPGEEHRIGDQYEDGVATYQPFPPRQLDARDYFKEQAARLFDITISDRGHRSIPEGGRGVAVRRRGGPIRRNLLDEARRGEAPDIARVWNRIVEAVETLPALPVSPFDALKQELAKNPDGSGRVPTLVEITGRELFINDDGEIEKINKTNDHKQRAAARFNNGDADILVFSPESGGTGASYHASETFADQRPREYIQNGFANNILTFVQSGGRTCRFGQVATPGHTVIDTGTVPDRRAQKIHNAKLRNLGAINEGDRQHDAIRDDVPDILNRIGADATSRVLEALPDIRARLGDPEYNPGRGDTAEAFLRKILNAQLLLDPDDNHKFNNLCDYEYNQLLEEMNSVGNNPLETQKLRGDVFIRARSRFIEDNDSLSTDPHDIHSALQEPVELLTGDWYREPG